MRITSQLYYQLICALEHIVEKIQVAMTDVGLDNERKKVFYDYELYFIRLYDFWTTRPLLILILVPTLP